MLLVNKFISQRHCERAFAIEAISYPISEIASVVPPSQSRSLKQF